MTRYPRSREDVSAPRSRQRAPHRVSASSRPPGPSPALASVLSRAPTPSRCAGAACIAALALAGCGGETAYVPRTPHVLALAMKRGQPALYRDGTLIEVSDASAALRGCPPAVMSALDDTADHRASFRLDNILGGLSGGLILITPPLFAVSGVFALLALHHQEAGNAALVDAINRHNDAPECRP